MNSLSPTGWVRPTPYYSYGRRSSFLHRNIYGVLLMTLSMGLLALIGLYVAKAPHVAAAKPILVSQKFYASTPINDAPTSVSALDNSTALQDVLNEWVATHPNNKWSIDVAGLGSDKRQAAVNKDAVYDSASIYKLLLLPKLFATYDLSSLSAVDLNVEGRGGTNLESCVELMLKVSDNPCGVTVGDKLGWSSANLTDKQLGLTHTDLNDPAGPQTSASDTTLFLTKLQQGQLFDSATTGYLLNLMNHQSLRGGIPAGCPNCSVADKTGDLGYVRHDAGIITYSSGQYVLTVFTDGAPYSQIAQLTSQIQSVMSTH